MTATEKMKLQGTHLVQLVAHRCDDCYWYRDLEKGDFDIGYCDNSDSDHYGHFIKSWHGSCPSADIFGQPSASNPDLHP